MAMRRSLTMAQLDALPTNDAQQRPDSQGGTRIPSRSRSAASGIRPDSGCIRPGSSRKVGRDGRWTKPLTPLEDAEEEAPDDGCELLLDAVAKQCGGNLLRGWRQELDPDGLLVTTYQHVVCLVKRLKLTQLPEDAAKLYKSKFLNGQSSHIRFSDIAPNNGKLFHRFKEWINRTFGGPYPMIAAFDVASRGSVNAQAFFDGCRKYGWHGSEKELHRIWSCIDPDDRGDITGDQVIFLELDPAMRDLEIFNLNVRKKNTRYLLMANTYMEEKMKGRNPKHRLALRPWQTDGFEKLPKMVCERKRVRREGRLQKVKQMKKRFQDEIQRKYGSAARAWRRELDPNQTFSISLLSLRRFCKRADITIDINILWTSMDLESEGTGQCPLEAICSEAPVLAAFRQWAVENLGSCAALWDKEVADQARRDRALPKSTGCTWSAGAAKKKMLFSAFSEVLHALGWPLAENHDARMAVLTSLDYFGCGFISRADLEWLDKWSPPEWLHAKPDPMAWKEMHSLIEKKYSHPLAAWRALLDKDDSNRICWDEFRQACGEIGFEGNAAGAYRWLDKDGSGNISMTEYHPESAEILGSFKDWAEAHYGSVSLAFTSLDADGGGTLSYQELKRACTRNRWGGDVKLLFSCLDIDKARDKKGKLSLSVSELAFLDSWEYEKPEIEESAPGDPWQQRVQTAKAERRSVAESTEQDPSLVTTLPRMRNIQSAGVLPAPLDQQSMDSWLSKFAAAPRLPVCQTGLAH